MNRLGRWKGDGDEKSILGGGNSMFKGPEVEGCLAIARVCRKASLTGAQRTGRK